MSSPFNFGGIGALVTVLPSVEKRGQEGFPLFHPQQMLMFCHADLEENPGSLFQEGDSQALPSEVGFSLFILEPGFRRLSGPGHRVIPGQSFGEELP